MSEPTKTIVTWSGKGGVLDRVKIPYNDATDERIAQAVIDLISSCMSMSEGDIITVTEE
jgi:hypothetical protein